MEMATRNRWDGWSRRRLARRRVLQGGAVGVVSLAGLAAGCNPTSTAPAAPATAPAAAAAVPTVAPAPAAPAVKLGGIYKYPVTSETPHLDPHLTADGNIVAGGTS